MKESILSEFDVCIIGAGPAGIAAGELGISVNRCVSLKRGLSEVLVFIMVLYLPKHCGNYHKIILMLGAETVVISQKMLKSIFLML